MKQNKVDRVEMITQKFLGLKMWATRAENLMLLGLADKADEAIGNIIKVCHQCRDIMREEVE